MVSYTMAILLLMTKDKRDMRPLFLKLGVALALSFVGFLYSQLRTRRIPPSLPPPPSGDGCKFNTHGRVGLKDDLCSIQTPLGSCDDSPFSAHEPSSHQVTIDSNIVGLSPTSKHSGEEEGLLLQDLNELVQEDIESISNKASISPRKEVVDTAMASKRDANKETEQEILKLRNTVKFLQEREKNLETQLLEYYGLKEQEAAVMELQNRLKINNLEAKFFTLKIESLQAENQRLEAQVADYTKVVADLESARAKIKMLKRKLRSDEEQNKELLSVLQQSVANLQEQEQMAILNDADVQNKLQRLKELGEESAELKRSNAELQQENCELAMRLESTQILATSILEDPETEELREANSNLRQEKEEIVKELESLRADRCADVEELVYLRWVNACLRYELRNYCPPPGKTVARDLSKNLSPKSEEKAKQLILEYANSEGIGEKGSSIVDFDNDYWSSSQTSYTDSGDYDDVSPATRTHNSSKPKFFKKLKSLVIRKDSHHSHHNHHNHHSHQSNHSHRTSSLDRNQTSSGGSGRNESASTTSFEDIVGTNSCDAYTPSSSQNNSSIIETPFTGIGARSDGQSTHIPLSSSSSRHSLDIQRIRNLGLEDIRDEERVRRSSDLGSQFGYKRMELGESGIIGLPSDNLQLDQDEPRSRMKLELIKFAEVLKGSRRTPKSRKSIA
ncbi:protein CHUP1, chloroplastic-like [Macadamia integrifolia]|uniref:protein CHUP1, chloroplastic-like n=1 Tax=Macadamia integrifolia TaxID=60698 RepID=UPI001C502445|nr:protein CHUP1, chloroplastic-like [Macadamia integrifolia]